MGQHSIIDLKILFQSRLPQAAADFVCEKTGISKTKVKDAMNKGALRLKRKGGPFVRVRKATFPLHNNDILEFHYDEGILSRVPEKAECLFDQGQYSVWAKPAGLLSQGTAYGDHCSLLRQAELHFGTKRQVYLIHRLDREVSGLMILAHSQKAAALLSGLIKKGLISKKYRAEVCGDLSAKGQRGLIEIPLEGKPAVSHFEIIAFDPDANRSTVDVIIETGRLHQIRRHFAMTGFPVCGDPRYGTGNKNSDGLKLAAVSLRFTCPFQKKEVTFSLP